MNESLLKDDLLITTFSPDNDEVIRQFKKGIKIFKPLQFSIPPLSTLNKGYVQKNSVRTLSPKESDSEQVMDYIGKDVKDNENVIKEDNSNGDDVFDKSSQKQTKEQNKNTYKKKKENTELERHERQNSYDSEKVSFNRRKQTSPFVESNSSFTTLPMATSSDSSISSSLTNKRLKKNCSGINVVMNDGTVIPCYSLTHPKRNRDFHNSFKEIPQNEHLINDYSCALQKDILFQGRIFVSRHYICFNSIFYWSNVSMNERFLKENSYI
jgi:hypothetical protein